MDYDEIKRRVEHNPDVVAELVRRVEAHQIEQLVVGWQSAFDNRQRKLIANCRTYTANEPGGLPGHNLMVIIERMAAMLDAAAEQGYRP